MRMDWPSTSTRSRTLGSMDADVRPAAGRSFVDRSQNAPGLIHSGDVVVRAFASIGWKWGGDWTGTKDYQHFSSNGK